MSECQKLRPGATCAGRQGPSCFEAIARETTGAQGTCMHLLGIPPGGRAKACKHATHETAIFVLEGRAKTPWGERLGNLMDTEAGDLIRIPADVPHLPFYDPGAPVDAVIARTDPHEQESVVLRPHLDPLVPA